MDDIFSFNIKIKLTISEQKLANEGLPLKVKEN